MTNITALHTSIVQALAIEQGSYVELNKCGTSHFGTTYKLAIHHSDGKTVNFFLKILPGKLGPSTCHGEYESLQAIYSACGHVPRPHHWGEFNEDGADKGFLLTEFMNISKQPADPKPLAAILADLHQKSVSPTGKFGFHIPTVHTNNVQAIAIWTDSWCELFTSHFSQILYLAKTGLRWPEFDRIGQLVLDQVVPRLLIPLQSGGRSIKPALVHGDCWDGNTAFTEEGRTIFFDVASFYGHNEYDLGDWRAPRHALSDPAYIKEYKQLISASEPVEDWDARNLLYSLTWNICNALFIPGSTQRQCVYDDMVTLCEKLCSSELEGIIHGG